MKAPYFRYEDTEEAAKKFLTQYHSSGEIPVPVEEIIEFHLGVDIVPVPNLKVECKIVGSVDDYHVNRQHDALVKM